MSFEERMPIFGIKDYPPTPCDVNWWEKQQIAAGHWWVVALYPSVPRRYPLSTAVLGLASQAFVSWNSSQDSNCGSYKLLRTTFWNLVAFGGSKLQQLCCWRMEMWEACAPGLGLGMVSVKPIPQRAEDKKLNCWPWCVQVEKPGDVLWSHLLFSRTCRVQAEWNSLGRAH